MQRGTHHFCILVIEVQSPGADHTQGQDLYTGRDLPASTLTWPLLERSSLAKGFFPRNLEQNPDLPRKAKFHSVPFLREERRVGKLGCFQIFSTHTLPQQPYPPCPSPSLARVGLGQGSSGGLLRTLGVPCGSSSGSSHPKDEASTQGHTPSCRTHTQENHYSRIC